MDEMKASIDNIYNKSVVQMTEVAKLQSIFGQLKHNINLSIQESDSILIDKKIKTGIDDYNHTRDFIERLNFDDKKAMYIDTIDSAYTEYITTWETLKASQRTHVDDETKHRLKVLEDNFNVMIDAWENGNADKLASFFMTSFDEYPDLYRRILTDRNKRWVSRISDMMREGDDILIIVGAAHLAGKDSVIELLRKRGYTVRQR